MSQVPAVKVAIVSGAARGIGAAIALRLADEGWAIGVLDLTKEAAGMTVDAITAAGGRAIAVGADVSVSDEVADAVTEVADTLGHPVVLVNNAGITRDNLLGELTEEDWDAVIRVHLRGAYLLSRAVQDFMVRASWGRIVNLSSTSALGSGGMANYATAKAGIQGLTKSLAIELGPHGVTVNAVAPGFIRTEMTRQLAERRGRSFEEFAAERVRQIPVARAGQPEDVAAAVAFFVGEEAGFVSGQILYVAGGPKA